MCNRILSFVLDCFKYRGVNFGVFLSFDDVCFKFRMTGNFISDCSEMIVDIPTDINGKNSTKTSAKRQVSSESIPEQVVALLEPNTALSKSAKIKK